MRISDWSSDVCSSDLCQKLDLPSRLLHPHIHLGRGIEGHLRSIFQNRKLSLAYFGRIGGGPHGEPHQPHREGQHHARGHRPRGPRGHAAAPPARHVEPAPPPRPLPHHVPPPPPHTDHVRP